MAEAAQKVAFLLAAHAALRGAGGIGSAAELVAVASWVVRPLGRVLSPLGDLGSAALLIFIGRPLAALLGRRAALLGIRHLRGNAAEIVCESASPPVDRESASPPVDRPRLGGAEAGRMHAIASGSPPPPRPASESDRVHAIASGSPPPPRPASGGVHASGSPAPQRGAQAPHHLLWPGGVPSSAPPGVGSWSEPPCSLFPLRTALYLRNGIKLPAASACMHPVRVDWLKVPTSALRDGSASDHLLGRACSLQEALGVSRRGVKVLAVAFVFPATERFAYALVTYFSGSPQTQVPLLESFLNPRTSEAWRTERLKLISAVREGPWLTKRLFTQTAISGKRPVLLARQLGTEYARRDRGAGAGASLVSFDVGSKPAAASSCRFILGHLSSVVIDFAFIVQGNTPRELQRGGGEALIGAVRVSRLCPSEASWMKV